MAHASSPSIHDVAPDDVEVLVIRDQQLTVDIGTGTTYAGSLHIAGDSDRERLENLIAIAGRIRQATLDLIASLNGNDVAEVHSALGKPLPLPDAAPLTGQTVRAVPA